MTLPLVLAVQLHRFVLHSLVSSLPFTQYYLYLGRMNRSVLLGACILAVYVVGALANGCPFHGQHTESFGTVGGYHARYVFKNR